MKSKRVAKLLKLYSQEVPEEKLLSDEADAALRARLRGIADRDDQVYLDKETTMGSGSAMEGAAKSPDPRAVKHLEGRLAPRTGLLLRATVAIAAAVLIAATVFWFPSAPTRSWEVTIIEEPGPLLRGEQRSTTYRFEITPGWQGFLYVLNLDESGECRWVYPYLDDAGLDDFGLSGPLHAGVTMRIPPAEYHGFESTGEGSETFYLIPSFYPLETKDLRTILRDILTEAGDMQNDPYSREEGLERIRKSVLKRLRERFPETQLIPLEPSLTRNN